MAAATQMMQRDYVWNQRASQVPHSGPTSELGYLEMPETGI